MKRTPNVRRTADIVNDDRPEHEGIAPELEKVEGIAPLDTIRESHWKDNGEHRVFVRLLEQCADHGVRRFRDRF